MLQSGCSLDHTKWKNLISILKDACWHLTYLDIKFQDAVPKCSGIYMLVADQIHLSGFYNLPEGVANVLYVGQSSNLHNRFKQHSSSQANPLIHKCKATFGTLRFAYSKVSNQHSLETNNWLSEAERLLILAFGPPANRTIPKANTLVGRVGQAEPIK